MTTPKISVIIPIYNARMTLSRCIESISYSSVFSQDIQIVGVDDGSTDNSYQYAESLIIDNFHPTSCVFRQSNSGACAARNAGFVRSLGEWVVFLDADDFYDNGFLDFVAQQDNPNHVITGNYQFFDGNSIGRFQLGQNIDVLQRIAQGDFTIPGAIAIPRLIAQRFPWDIALSADQDGEWLGRIAFSGISIVFEPEIGIVYSVENQYSISKKKDLTSLESRIASAENLLKLINTSQNFRPYHKAIAQRMDLIAFTYFWNHPQRCIDLRKRARLIDSKIEHNIKGKQGVLRNALGFYATQLVIRLLNR